MWKSDISAAVRALVASLGVTALLWAYYLQSAQANCSDWDCDECMTWVGAEGYCIIYNDYVARNDVRTTGCVNPCHDCFAEDDTLNEVIRWTSLKCFCSGAACASTHLSVEGPQDPDKTDCNAFTVPMRTCQPDPT